MWNAIPYFAKYVKTTPPQAGFAVKKGGKTKSNRTAGGLHPNLSNPSQKFHKLRFSSNNL